MASLDDKRVLWQEDDDNNPQNWPLLRKWTITILISIFAFDTLMTSTMVAPALSQITKDLNIPSDAETQLILSIYVLAYAIGFFLWAPLSEMYGRIPIIQVASTWFFVWDIVCGFASNKSILIVARLMSGAGSASAVAVAPGIIADIWKPETRGRALAMLSIVSLLGPSIGPILGGVVAQHGKSSWRWVFWSTAAFDAVLQVLGGFFLRETHHATIIARLDRKQSLRRSSCSTLSSRESDERPTSRVKILTKTMQRPFHLLLTQPILQILSVYNAVNFGIQYIVLSTYTELFTSIYHQSLMIASLHYLSLGVGYILGAQTCGIIIDRLYIRRSQLVSTESENGDCPSLPASECRIFPMLPGVVLLTAGLLITGLTAEFHQHWIWPDVGAAIFGFGNQIVTQCTNAYVIDVFSLQSSQTARSESNLPPSMQLDLKDEKHQNIGSSPALPSKLNHTSVHTPTLLKSYSASAMASIWSLKSIGGFIFPLFGGSMSRKLGWGWTGIILAIANLVPGVGVSIVLLVWGKKLRKVGERRWTVGNRNY